MPCSDSAKVNKLSRLYNPEDSSSVGVQIGIYDYQTLWLSDIVIIDLSVAPIKFARLSFVIAQFSVAHRIGIARQLAMILLGESEIIQRLNKRFRWHFLKAIRAAVGRWTDFHSHRSSMIVCTLYNVHCILNVPAKQYVASEQLDVASE